MAPRVVVLDLGRFPSLRAMSSPIRRKRGTPTVGVQVDLAPDVKELIDRYMQAAGVPQWAIIEAAIRAGKPGPNGIPIGWDLPVALNQPPLDLDQLSAEVPMRRSA
ncbi:hypothetical protein ACR5MH_0270 (plasmid) [Streptomyces sp. L7]